MESRVVFQLFLLCLLFQSSLSEVRTVNWTIAGVLALNNRIEVTPGDTLEFMCGSSSSNVILQRSQDQYDRCNATLGPPVQVLGKCTSPASKPSIEIQQSSAQLNSSTSFSPDTTVYLTSYSNGMTLVSAFNDTVHGGECLSGLKLEVYINSIPTTGQVASPSTVSTTTEKPSSVTPPPTTPPKDNETTQKMDISDPLGIMNSGTHTHAHFSLLCLVLCLLITCLLR